MAESKRLIIGGTGYIGKFVVEASAKLGHPTFALVRENVIKGKGNLYIHESLVKAIKQVDVVISTLGQMQIADQVKIIAAIKEAGNVKEFGTDVDHAHAVEPVKSALALKSHIRRAIEVEGIPYTYVVSNAFAVYFLATLCQLGVTAAPRDEVTIFGDGNLRVFFNDDHDIGTYTIRAVDDSRTLNTILYIKPPKNTLAFNELVELWEELIGKTLEKTNVPEEQRLMDIRGAPFTLNIMLAINYSAFVKGDLDNFVIESSFGVEASELYPDVKYITVEDYLKQLV